MTKVRINIFIFILLNLVNVPSFAQEIVSKNDKKDKIENKLQRVINLIDSRLNTKSQLLFFTNNYGLIGFDHKNNRAGFSWQSDSIANRLDAKINYLFGNGITFSAQKRVEVNLEKFTVNNFDLNGGAIHTIAGRLEDGDTLNADKVIDNQVFFSTDYDENGRHLFDISEPNWAIWSNNNNPFGRFIYDNSKRNKSSGKPVIISDEDIFINYKVASPLKLQYETVIYTWGKNGKNPKLKDVIVVNTLITNKSNDTLFDCNISSISDIDITPRDKLFLGTNNDNLKIINYNPKVVNPNDKILISYTDSSNVDVIDRNANNNPKYGYLFSKLIYSSPFTEQNNGYLVQENKEDISNDNFPKIRREIVKNGNAGMIAVEEDIYPEIDFFNKEKSDVTNPKYYDFINKENYKESHFPQDIRTFITNEKFNLLPNESVRFIYCIGVAKSSLEFTDKLQNLIPNPMNKDLDLVTATIDEIYNEFEQITSSVSNLILTKTRNNLGIYPNPASNEIEVFFEFEIDKSPNFANEINYIIQNTNGEVIAKDIVKSNSFSYYDNDDDYSNLNPNHKKVKFKIDVSKMTIGSHILSIEDNIDKIANSNNKTYFVKFQIVR